MRVIVTSRIGGTQRSPCHGRCVGILHSNRQRLRRGTLVTLQILINIQEERGFLFGRLFGLTALIQSDALTRPSTTTATITDTVDELIKLATKKSWLREPVATALCNLTSKLPDHPDGKHIAEKILEGLEKNSLRQTLDGVAIAMRISALPKIRRPKLSSTAKRLWNDLDPLHHSNAQILTRLLKDVPDETGNENKQTGSSTGDLHFVWRLILERYLRPSKKLYKVKDLWQNVVESTSHSFTACVGCMLMCYDRWLFCGKLHFAEEVSWFSDFHVILNSTFGARCGFYLHQQFFTKSYKPCSIR